MRVAIFGMNQGHCLTVMADAHLKKHEVIMIAHRDDLQKLMGLEGVICLMGEGWQMGTGWNGISLGQVYTFIYSRRSTMWREYR